MTSAISGVNQTQGIGGRSGLASPDPGFDALVRQFRDLASRDPLDALRDQILKSHGLSEQDYQQLSPAARQAIDQEIAEAVKRKMGVASGHANGDVVALQTTGPAASPAAQAEALYRDTAQTASPDAR